MVVIGDKAYDSEVNHILVRDILHALSASSTVVVDHDLIDQYR